MYFAQFLFTIIVKQFVPKKVLERNFKGYKRWIEKSATTYTTSIQKLWMILKMNMVLLVLPLIFRKKHGYVGTLRQQL